MFQLLCRLLACCVVVCVVVGRQFASVCVLRCTWDFGFPMRFPWHQALASHTLLRAIAMSGWIFTTSDTTPFGDQHHTTTTTTPWSPPKNKKNVFFVRGNYGLLFFWVCGVCSLQSFPCAGVHAECVCVCVCVTKAVLRNSPNA